MAKVASLALAVFLTISIALVYPGTVLSDHLSAVDTLSIVCDFNSNPSVSWDPVTDAGKYSVNFMVGYDTDDDGVVDITENPEFGTSDRTDELAISMPFLHVPFSEFHQDVTLDGIDNPQDPIEVEVRIKALHQKGPKSGQNPFSGLVTCTLPN